MKNYLIALGIIVVAAAGALTGVHTQLSPPHTEAASHYALKPSQPAWHTAAGSAVLGVLGGPRLWTYRALVERPIASVTKTMTANLVLTHPTIYPLNRPITITRAEVLNDRRGILKDDSEVPLAVGQKVHVQDLLWALMLPSADDSAWVLADNYPGGKTAFIGAMNQRARQLGMAHTHYVDPDGVNHRGYSTANDLMRLLSSDMAISEFRHLVRTKTAKTAFGTLTNLNQLLWTYPGAAGIKTGWTPWAGSCLAFAATRRVQGDRLTLMGVVLGEPSFGPMFQDVAQLLNSGFAEAHWEQVLPTGTPVGSVKEMRGWLRGSVAIPLVLSRPLGTFTDARQARLEVRWNRAAVHGYAAGTVVGQARLLVPGVSSAWVPVVVRHAVTVRWWERL